MTIADYSSRHPDRPGPPQVTPATDFAALAIELDAARDLRQVLAKVIEFAVTSLDCGGANVHLRQSGRQVATTMASAPRFAPAVAPSYVGSRHTPGLIIDLTAGRSTFGTIAFYPTPPDGFTTDDMATANLLAVHAALAVAAKRTTTHLLTVRDARTVIGQAQGMVMERYAVDADAAFALLRRCSQDNNIRLQDAARSLITTRQLPGNRPVPTPSRRP